MFMAHFIFNLLILFILSACVNGSKNNFKSTSAFLLKGCYESHTDYRGNLNTLTICKIKNKNLQIETFYTNNLAGSDPTICRQSATLYQKGNIFNIKGKRGSCDNGRFQVPYQMECVMNSKISFSCFSKEDLKYEIIFNEKT